MTRKKKTVKATPAHAPGAKVYIEHYQGKEGGILQAEVLTSEVKTMPVWDKESGKITGTRTAIFYELTTAYGPYIREEDQLIKSFPEIARTFSQRFLTLLK